MTGPRLAPPRVPTGKLTVQPPPELQPSDGGSNLLTSMLPMLGSVGADRHGRHRPTGDPADS